MVPASMESSIHGSHTTNSGGLSIPFPATEGPPPSLLLRRRHVQSHHDPHPCLHLPNLASSQKPQNARNFHDLERALRALESESHLQPSVQDFVSLLSKCRDNRGNVLRLYSCMQKNGLEHQVSIGNGLIPLLAQSGNVSEAQKIFDKLDYRNEASWTSLISGYIRCGKPQRAIALYHAMKEDNSVSPDGFTFVAFLKACTNTRDVRCGHSIHAEVVKLGILDIDLFVGNTLVHMYAKLGLILTAQDVFLRLPIRDSVSWNAMISGYAEHGYGEDALRCFDQMKVQSFSPTAATYVCTLRACGAIKAAERGKEIHGEIEKNEMYQNEISINNALVGMYAKCGLLAKAKEEFDELLHRDLVAWTALISGYVEDGNGNEALKCFKEMQEEEVFPDNVTFLCIVKACSSISDVKQGQEVHIIISKRGLVEGDLVIGNALVDMYAKCGFLSEMQTVFNNLFARDIVSWNALLSGYVEYGYSNEALVHFKQMQTQGFSPDATTLACVLKACSSIKLTEKCQELHIDIMRKGIFEDDLLIGNAVVDAYGKCGLFAEAKLVFNRMPNRDVVSWNVLIWAYVELGDNAEVFEYYEQMQIEHLSPDVVTYSIILRACGNIGCLEKGKVLHAEIAKKGFLDKELVRKTLVEMYGKCGSLAEAQEVFERLPLRDIVSWTSLITGYAQLGDCRSVCHTFDRMIMDGVVPNLITFFSVLNVCSHSGLIETGESYFEDMVRNYNILPTLEHYTCMIDLYSRAGQIDNAMAMINKMPFSPDLAVWHIILGACQKWGNLEVGTLAFEYAVQLREEDQIAYICLSNIYAFANV